MADFVVDKRRICRRQRRRAAVCRRLEDVAAIFRHVPGSPARRDAQELNDGSRPTSLAFAPGRVSALRRGGSRQLAEQSRDATPSRSMPLCWRSAAESGTENMQAKRVRLPVPAPGAARQELDNGIRSTLRSRRLDDGRTAPARARARSDVPHLLRFYEQLFRKKASSPGSVSRDCRGSASVHELPPACCNRPPEAFFANALALNRSNSAPWMKSARPLGEQLPARTASASAPARRWRQRAAHSRDLRPTGQPRCSLGCVGESIGRTRKSSSGRPSLWLASFAKPVEPAYPSRRRGDAGTRCAGSPLAGRAG